MTRATILPLREREAYERLASLRPGKVVVHFIHPPIPMRQFDYQASFDADEPDDDGNMLAGHGKTEVEALQDLADTLEAMQS